MKLLTVDGNSIINRSFYGVRPLSTKSGIPTNAVFGFLKIMDKMIKETQPDCVTVAFDLKAPTFRHEKYDLYKANRKGMPDELAVQLPIVKEILTLLGYHIIEKEGFEADDILGTFARICVQNNTECIIATGDRDSLQLVNENVTVRLATNKDTIIYDTDKIIETYGVKPENLIEVKALMGDSSDNIPGVKGIGEKTALELIAKYNNIEYIFDNVDSIELKPRVKTILSEEESRKSAFLSRELATIYCDVPIETEIEKYRVKPINTHELKDKLVELEMYSLLENYSLNSSDITPSQSTKTFEFTVKTNPDFNEVKQKLENLEFLDFIFENKENSKTKENIQLSLGHANDENNYLLYINAQDIIYMFDTNAETALKNLVLNSEKSKRTYDAKSLYLYLYNNELEINNINFDLLLAAYLLNPNANNYDVNILAAEYANNIKWTLSNVHFPPPPARESERENIYSGFVQTQQMSVNNGESPPSEAEKRERENIQSGYVQTQHMDKNKDVCFKIAAFSYLCDVLDKELTALNMADLLHEIELPLSKVLASIEHEGFLIDIEGIRAFGNELEKDIAHLADEINELAGQKCNPNSPKELGFILFDKLGLKGGKKTKTGFSTNAEVLEKLRNVHPIVNKILQYRHLSKLNSTYVTGLLKVAKADGRVYTSFKQTETRTGRISSVEPNLQNIPVRTERGANMRKFFIAPENRVLIDADYSQIELRILAAISEDEEMIFAFNNNDDIHSITASEVFGVPRMILPPELRSRAKAINFGIVYGISAFSLANDIGTTNSEAKKYIEKYFETYPGVKKYMDGIIEKAKADNYVTTMFGRRRPLADINSSNHIVRTAAERIALNTPIQGTSADIIKIAMINCHERLEKEKLDAKLILQIHDELIIECSKDDAEKAALILKEEMKNAASLKVELTVDVNTGKNWFKTK